MDIPAFVACISGVGFVILVGAFFHRTQAVSPFALVVILAWYSGYTAEEIAAVSSGVCAAVSALCILLKALRLVS